MVRLNKISSITSGYYFRSSMMDFADGVAKLIQLKDLDAFDIDSLQSIDAPTTGLKKGDILLSNKGKFRSIIMPTGGNFVFPSSIYVIRLTSDRYIPEFLNTYFNSESGQTQLSLLATGAYISSLTKSALGELELPDISLDRQRKIAEIDATLSKYRLATNEKANMIDSLKDMLIKEKK